MTPDDDRLLKLASSISDGTPVDWDRAALGGAGPEETALLGELRMLAGIAELHRRPAPLELVTPGPLRRFGHLEIEERVGTGAFGEVFRARDVRLDREVALKIIHASGTDPERVLREGRHLARVRHPNVVAVHGAEISGGQVGLWMEFVSGRTLSAIVKEQGRLSAREAASIGVVLCRALAAVHAAGLLHLDLKPGNVVREEGGRLVLMDFGMGQDVVGPAPGEAGIGGTPVYMAPERLEGHPPAPASDLYSLGVVLFYLVTGTHPVEGATLQELWSAHDSGRVRHLRDLRPDLPAGFVQVVDRATARNPRDRFASAGDMEKALVRLLDVNEWDDGSEDVPARKPAPAGAAAIGAGRSSAETAGRPGHAGRNLLLAGTVLVLGLLSLAAVRWLVPGSVERGVPPGAASPKGKSGAPAKEPTGSGPAAGSAATPAPPAGSAGIAYTVEASFQSGEAALPLRNGDRVSVGDSLSLAIRASEPLYVYVVNEDERGDAHLLFPLPGFHPANPVPAGGREVLPGERDGRRFYWQVTSAGGREHFLVITSRERLKELEADLLSLSQVATGAVLQYPRLSEASASRIRGIGGLVEAPARTAGPKGGRLYEIAQALPAGPVETNGVWVRRIDLENPSR